MDLENRKINLINWISSLQDESVIEKMENLQKGKSDWWDVISDEDKNAICEGLDELEKGNYLSDTEVRERINKKFI